MPTMTLGYLQLHWGSVYEITEALGAWRAVRRDNQRSLVAACAEELRIAIISDYAAQPVRPDGAA